MINFKNYKFMSLGSNCADLWYLGSNRLHGPADNIVIKTATGVNYLLNNTLFNKIYSDGFTEEIKTWANNDDIKNILNYEDFKIVHNNPETDKFKLEFKKRSDRLLNFIADISAENKWLVFNLNDYFATKDHKPTLELLKLIKILKDKKLYDKTIFVQLKRTKATTENKWESWIDSDYLFKKTIIINDVIELGAAQKQFKEQFINILKGN